MNLTRKIIPNIHFITDFVSKNQSVCNYLPKISWFQLNCNRNFSMESEAVTKKRVLMSTQLKKRPVKKKKALGDSTGLRINAFSTAEEYDLDGLSQSLSVETSFKQNHVIGDPGVIIFS